MIVRQPSPFHSRRAFTLVELLIVIGVLVALAGLVIPTVRRGAAMVRRVKCASNLSSIGQAYGMYLVDRKMRGGDVLRAPQWAYILREYFSELNPEAFICPEDLVADWSLPYVQMRSDWAFGPMVYPIFELEPVWLEKDHNEFIPKPKVWKVNDDVYQAMLQDVSLRQNMPMYTPGSDPDKFWFILEDIGDDDFYDFDVGVELLDESSTVVTGKHWSNALANHYVIDPDGTHHQVIDEVGPFVYSVPQTSYAMNSQAFRLAPGSPRITFLDYEAKACNVMDDVGADDGWNALHAPRHLGQVHALLGDGSVVALWPDEINPEAAETNIDQYWGDAD